MLTESVDRILARLSDDDLVLDVGGWARPFTRADWVIDLMPYASRGEWGRDGSGPERFDATRWVQRDICLRTPWPFEDDQFAFVVCAQTLEDVRDPLWVCDEMMRVARAGYLEVPSRLLEQSYGVQGPWAGYSHHRWLVDVDGDSITFTFKPHLIHRRRDLHFPFGFHEQLSESERITTMWWEGGFERDERFLFDAAELERYLHEFVERGSAGREVPSRALGVGRLVLDRLGVRRWGP